MKMRMATQSDFEQCILLVGESRSAQISGMVVC